MRSNRSLKYLVPTVVGLALLWGAPGQAAGNVTVTLRTADGSYYTNAKACTVSVPDGADGIAVLDAAKAKGCISSYQVSFYSFGAFLDCIDGVCNDPAPAYLRYWSMRTNTLSVPGVRVCEPTSYGVSDYRSSQGSELSFTFETAATGFAPVVC